jgi:dipeptide transport system ATP-binding protein
MTAPVVEAKGVRRHYEVKRGLFRRPATLKAVDGVSFALRQGKTLAVVGESGCGKSTLGRMVAMIEPPSEGHLLLDGTDVFALDRSARRPLRRTVQMVFQDPYGSLNPRLKVGSIVEEPLKINTQHSASQREAAAREMLARVGLRPEHYRRYPHMFSGGQRQRIAIARALMLRPKIVVADEPLSALDMSIQAQVLNLLMDLQQEFQLAYLFISHDLGVVRHIADEIMVMYLGLVMEQGPKEAIFSRPLHPYTRALLSSTPTTEPAARRERIVLRGELPSPLDPPRGCVFSTRCPSVTERCRSERPVLRELAGRQIACDYAERFASAVASVQPGATA